MELVRKLRRIHSKETLELVVAHMEKLPSGQREVLRSAADHRRAELVTGQFFDRVPSYVWRYVR
jgi:hemolysin expression modulating protein